MSAISFLKIYFTREQEVHKLYSIDLNKTSLQYLAYEKEEDKLALASVRLPQTIVCKSCASLAFFKTLGFVIKSDKLITHIITNILFVEV